MKKQFVDTWFWITLIVQNETFHKQALEFIRKCSYRGDEFYTSASVIAETTSGILHSRKYIKAPERKLEPVYAFKFFEQFKAVVTTGQFKILAADQQQIGSALELLKDNFRSMPGLSYFDCESVTLCKAYGLPRILTKDADFEVLGVPIDEEWRAILEG